ncbi:hypothetical protein VC894_16865 [Citrobacter freundii]|nr:hypothetical protein [Citrobacter freundii]
MTTNHPAHGHVSLDRLHQIREILSKATAQSDGGNLGYAMADAVKVIEGAIAAFNAELYVPTVQCWSCREVIEVSAVGDCDGYCPKCDSPIDLDEEPYDAAILQAGNSPVIPDGWKLVPIDPTKDMLRAGQSVVGFWLNTVHCYSKMLAAAPAAPQQEVKAALEHGMQRYAGAMQKLSEGDN